MDRPNGYKWPYGEVILSRHKILTIVKIKSRYKMAKK